MIVYTFFKFLKFFIKLYVYVLIVRRKKFLLFGWSIIW